MNIRRIQQYLGHSSLNTTMFYLHLTTQGHERACSIINDLMSQLPLKATPGQEGDDHDND